MRVRSGNDLPISLILSLSVQHLVSKNVLLERNEQARAGHSHACPTFAPAHKIYKLRK